MKRIWFHGTSKKIAKKILKEGFQPNTFFARSLEHALAFGGKWVFEVVLNVDDSCWQVVIPEATSIETIMNLTKYQKKAIMHNLEKQEALFLECFDISK